MKSHSASTIDLQVTKNTIQRKPVRSSSGQSWQKSSRMFAGKPSLGGILVVVDDPAIHKLARRILENVGCDVIEAEDGQEAIQVLGGGENPMVVDLIITDLNMSKVNGLETIAYFQKEFPSIPLIVLTGIADAVLALSFMRRGISDFLVKPVDGKKLTSSVANAIAQGHFSWA